jgi:diguanylate cyclase (GGDEF)-like protein/PAS domain S-box-containing protein
MISDDILQFINALPEGYAILSTDGTILSVNKHAVALFGDHISDAVGHHLREYTISCEDEINKALHHWSRSRTPMPAAIKWKANASQQDVGWRCHGFLLKPATQSQPALLVLRCTFGKTLVGNFLTLNEELKRERALLSKLQHSRMALEQEHEKALVTLHSIGDGVITTDVAGKIEYMNPVAEQLTGWKTTAASGKPILKIFKIVHEISRKPVADPVTRCLAQNRIVELANHTVLISREGKEYVIEDSAAPIHNKLGKVLGAVLVFRDATDDRLTRHQLEYLAHHDTLTGLKNRLFFEQQLKQTVDTASRGKHQYCLLYIDLDQFKVINDTVGHAAGDELLTQVAMKFSQRVRQGDIFARLGGDEFGVIIDSIDIDNIAVLIDSYQQILQGFQFSWHNNKYDISCSIGATIITRATTSSAEAMRQADIACYIAKKNGRNRYHLYQDQDQYEIATMGEVNIANDIRHALEHDNFVLYFQPIISLNSGDCFYEVLVRMEKNGDVLMPGAFIPVAERHGLMLDIDLWVIRHALEAISQKLASSTPCRLTINLSGTSLGHDEVNELLRDKIQQQPEIAQYIHIEITETSAVGQIDKVVKLMSALRKLGVTFALDDFGTGFSSFTYLKHLPVDFIKIDGTFVRDIVDDPVDQAMVRSINHIAHSLNKITIAEFVESEAILQELKVIGVDMVQGYHIGKPAPKIIA